MSELVLITISGFDRPGLSAKLIASIEEFSVSILDIGQSVIHDHVNMGMLLEIHSASGETDSASGEANILGSNASAEVVKRLLYKVHELGLQAVFRPIEHSEYEGWVEQQYRAKYIVSLISRRISSQHIASLTSILYQHELNISSITRLSPRMSLTQDPSQHLACVEFTVSGIVKSLDKLKQQLTELSDALQIDVAFQRESMYRKNRRLVCFDMDSTLIEAEVIDELAKRAGVGDRVAAITERAMRGELNFNDSFKERVALLKGLDEQVLADVARTLPITEGAETLITALRHLGYKTAILSGGFTYFGKYLQERLGIDYVYANELDIENGQVTGNVVGTIVDGNEKARLLAMLAQQQNISLEQVVAVGDGANDLPMLSRAGLGVAFKAKPLVKAEAEQAISNVGLDSLLYLIGLPSRKDEGSE